MKITENIHQLQIDFEIALSPENKISRFVNVLIIFDKNITLIDSGVKGSEHTIFDYIKEQGRNFTEIDKIILSHAHPDHIGSAAAIKSRTGCKVYCHELEQQWVEDIELQYKQRPVPGFFNLVDKPVTIDGFLEDNQLISIGENLTINCLHTPGHSKGLLSFFFIEDKIMFTADAIPLKNDLPNYDNFTQLEKSLKTIKNSGNYITLLTSWTPAITDSSQMYQLILEGETYLKKLDKAVKKHYKGEPVLALDNCKNCIDELGLPPFFINPIVNKAFCSHL